MPDFLRERYLRDGYVVLKGFKSPAEVAALRARVPPGLSMTSIPASSGRCSARAINKIGHALHDLDPEFRAFSHGTALAQVAREVGLAQSRLWQSM